MWEEYNRSKSGTSFYDDDVVCDAIERTYELAHDVIGAVPPDRTPKFPNERLVPHDTTSFKHLVQLCKEGLVDRGLADKPAYIARLKEELGVIKQMKNADYFISYQKIAELARKVVLLGPGRGCFVPETRVKLNNGDLKQISKIRPGEHVLDLCGNSQRVDQIFVYDIDEDVIELTVDESITITCTNDHKFMTLNRGWVAAQDLSIHDYVVDVERVNVIHCVTNHCVKHYVGRVYDLCVENSHTYNVEGIGVHNSGGGSLVAYVLHIHDMDPLRWDLPFSRFLSVYRCLDPKTYVLMSDGSKKMLADINVGDSVVADDGKSHFVLNKHSSKHEQIYCIHVNDAVIKCSGDHLWSVKGNDGQIIEKRADELTCEDETYVRDESSMHLQKIKRIDVVHESQELIDIEVADRHRFWVSNTGKDWILTHNCGSPDIDCVHERHLVLMSDGTYKSAGSIVVGDSVIGGDGRPHKVTATYSRGVHFYEDPLWILVKADDGTLGNMLVVPKHKFIKIDGDIVYAMDLKVGDVLKSACRAEVVSVERAGWESVIGSYVDLTVEDNHCFHIIPFDVIVDNEGNISHAMSYDL
jgi:hypothetical protein